VPRGTGDIFVLLFKESSMKKFLMPQTYALLTAGYEPNMEQLFLWAEVHSEMRAEKREQNDAFQTQIEFSHASHRISLELLPRAGEEQIFRLSSTLNKGAKARIIFSPLMLREEAIKLLAENKVEPGGTNTRVLEQLIELSHENDAVAQYLSHLPFIDIVGGQVAEVKVPLKKGAPRHSLDFLHSHSTAMRMVKVPALQLETAAAVTA
jgi:hypothetical protein